MKHAETSAGPFEGEVRGGQDERPTKHQVLALIESCVLLIGSLGLRLEHELLRLVIGKTIQFVEEAYGTPYVGERWMLLAAKRELIRVLAVLHDREIREAFALENHPEERRLARVLDGELSRIRSGWENAGVERCTLDPEAWGLHPLDQDPQLQDYSKFLHLSLLAEFVRLQDRHLSAVEDARGRDENTGAEPCVPRAVLERVAGG